MSSQQKHLPKDAQVILSIMKDMGINDYDPRVLTQLLEFTYRYVTTVLEDSRVFANHAKKKAIDLDDVKLAVQMTTDRIFTNPPAREILLEVARTKNNSQLPLVKPHCGLRLPPDRYCLASCNYRLKSLKKPQLKQQTLHLGASTAGYMNSSVASNLSSASAIKIQTSKPQQSAQQTVSIVKRPGNLPTMPTVARTQSIVPTVARTQAITIPKPVIKFTTGANLQKPIAKPKIQISAGASPGTIKVESNDINSGAIKRKREDESEEYEIE